MLETGLQDDSVRVLAGTLLEMLATADMIHDLQVILSTTDVIVDISCQSLRVASLIHEYTKLSMPGNSSFTLLNFKSNDAFHRVNIQNRKQRFKIPY